MAQEESGKGGTFTVGNGVNDLLDETAKGIFCSVNLDYNQSHITGLQSFYEYSEIMFSGCAERFQRNMNEVLTR